METNYEALEIIQKFLWSWENEIWNALTEYHCDPKNCKYSKEYILKCYKELLEIIIEDWLHYKDAKQCIFNASS